MGVCLSLKSIKFNVKEESSIMKADETKRKREILLGINPCIYGLNYHDPAVVVLIDGRVVFGVEEERCNRVKHSKGVFPSLALAECLTYCNLTWDDIDAVVIGYEPALWMNRLNLELLDIINPFVSCVSNSIQIRGSEIVEKIIRTNIVDRYTFFRSQENVRKLIIEKCSPLETTKVMFCEHHLAHIASSYEVSGFSEAVGIVVDGIGETAVTTLWRIQNHQYEKILQIDYPNSLGYFYAIATKFLGFEPWGGEGKTMALAAYGKKNKEIADRLKSAFTLNGAFYDVSHFMHNHNAGFLMMNEDELIHELEALLGFSAREKDASITDEHIDFAWFVQDYLERSVIRLINYAVQKTGIVNVCAAGGVFMNCKMNMVIRETSEATNFYVQPLSSDIGLTVGAGLYHTSQKHRFCMNSLDLGPEYSDNEIEEALIRSSFKSIVPIDLASTVAEFIAEGKIVCWFEGKMEMGARALGSRSILANPQIPSMSDKINKMIKHREKWRPFACSILKEYCSIVLENYDSRKDYPFMIEAFRVKEEWKSKIPSVIHKADGTTRPQTVSCETNPLYYKLIKRFYDITGCPLILNTSFNDKGQPIVMTPKDAVDFFETIPVDVLVIGKYMLLRN